MTCTPESRHLGLNSAECSLDLPPPREWEDGGIHLTPLILLCGLFLGALHGLQDLTS